MTRVYGVPGNNTTRSYTINARGLGSGVHWADGYYDTAAAEDAATQIATTQTYGASGRVGGAHAILVAKEAGAAAGGAGAVTIVVSGTSVTDLGVETGGDSEVIVSDVTAMSANEYFETVKKWTGQITYTLTVGATGHTTYSATYNYGFAKYDDVGNTDFIVTTFEVTGVGDAADTGFDVELIHHTSSELWTFHATAFVPGPAAHGTIAKLTDDQTDQTLANDIHFAYKRTELNHAVNGAGAEGYLIKYTLGSNNSISYANFHVGVDSG